MVDVFGKLTYTVSNKEASVEKFFTRGQLLEAMSRTEREGRRQVIREMLDGCRGDRLEVFTENQAKSVQEALGSDGEIFHPNNDVSIGPMSR